MVENLKRNDPRWIQRNEGHHTVYVRAKVVAYSIKTGLHTIAYLDNASASMADQQEVNLQKKLFTVVTLKQMQPRRLQTLIFYYDLAVFALVMLVVTRVITKLDLVRDDWQLFGLLYWIQCFYSVSGVPLRVHRHRRAEPHLPRETDGIRRTRDAASQADALEARRRTRRVWRRGGAEEQVRHRVLSPHKGTVQGETLRGGTRDKPAIPATHGGAVSFFSTRAGGNDGRATATERTTCRVTMTIPCSYVRLIARVFPARVAFVFARFLFFPDGEPPPSPTGAGAPLPARRGLTRSYSFLRRLTRRSCSVRRAACGRRSVSPASARTS